MPLIILLRRGLKQDFKKMSIYYTQSALSKQEWQPLSLKSLSSFQLILWMLKRLRTFQRGTVDLFRSNGCGWWVFLTLANCSHMNTKWALKINPLVTFCIIAILRFLFNETRPTLTKFRVEITKGIIFESDWF